MIGHAFRNGAGFSKRVSPDPSKARHRGAVAMPDDQRERLTVQGRRWSFNSSRTLQEFLATEQALVVGSPDRARARNQFGFVDLDRAC